MKRSELTVTMSMTTFDELMDYKNRYMKLRDELDSTIKINGQEYEFDVTKALKIVKEISHTPEDSNIVRIT